MERRLHVALRSDPACAARLRSEVAAWLAAAGVNGPVGSDITSAVNEAFVNAVEHPLDRATDRVEVEGVVSSGEVVVRVRDDGTWNEELDPHRQHFGLGVITAMMDSVAIEHGASGTVVTLRRKLAHELG